MVSEEEAGQRGPTLGTIKKIKDYVRENGSRERPVVANDIHTDDDTDIGASHEGIKEALDYLVEDSDMVRTTVQRGTREFPGYFWKETVQG